MPQAQDAVWLDVLPSMKKFAPALATGATKAGSAAGAGAGTAMGSSMQKKLLTALGIGAIAVKVGQDFVAALNIDKANDKMAASLGLTEATSKKAGAVAGKLYRNAYGESMADTTDAVEAVLSSIEGMSKGSSKDLERVTAKALDFASAFDVEVSRSSQVAGQMIKNGLAKDADEAFDLMVAASQKVPKALRGDLLDAVDEYGPTFANLGYSGEEAMAMLVKGAEKGAIGIDKTGDAVKEFTIRSTDMSTASVDAYGAIGLNAEDMAKKVLAGGDDAKEATDKIIDGLLGIEDPAARSNAAIALFGTPLEDLSVNEIPTFLKGMKSTGEGLGDVGGAAERMGDTLNDNLGTRIEGWKRNLTTLGTNGMLALIEGFESGQAAGTGFTGVMSKVGVFVKSATKFVRENKDAVTALAIGVGVAVAAWAGMSILTAVRTWIAGTTIAQRGLNAALKANPIGLVITAVGLLVVGLVYLYRTNDKTRKIIDKAWAGIKRAVSSVVTWVRGTAWPVMQRALGAIGSKALWLWRSAFRPALSSIWSVAKRVFGWIRNVGAPWVARAAGVMGRVIGRLWKNNFRPALSSIWSFSRRVLGWVRNTGAPWVVKAAGTMGRVVKRLWTLYWNVYLSRILRAGKRVFGWLKNTGLPWVRRATEGISTAVKTMWRKASKVLSSFRTGLGRLRDRFTDIKSSIGRIWSGLTTTMAKPIRSVLKFINDKFIGGINKLLRKVKVKTIPLIPVPGLPVGNISGASSKNAKGLGGKNLLLNQGGKVPGFSPTDVADNIDAKVTAGEFILPVQATRRIASKMGRGFLEKLRRGLPGYANGGMVGVDKRDGDAATDSGDGGGISGFFKSLTSKPLNYLKGKLSGLLKGMTAKGPFAAAAVSKLRDVGGSIAKWVKERIFGSDAAATLGGEGGTVPGNYRDAKGKSWKTIFGMLQRANLNPVVRTGGTYRPNYTTKSGYKSRHSIFPGLALDMPPNLGIEKFLNARKKQFRELYLPTLNKFWIFGGQDRKRYPSWRTTIGNHNYAGGNPHIHAAYSRGGEVRDPRALAPTLYDSGGVLPPGDTWVRNRTGRNEMVINPAKAPAAGKQFERHYHAHGPSAAELWRLVQSRESDELALMRAGAPL